MNFLKQLNKYQLAVHVSEERIIALKNKLGEKDFMDTFKISNKEELGQILNVEVRKSVTESFDVFTASRNLDRNFRANFRSPRTTAVSSQLLTSMKHTYPNPATENGISQVFYQSPQRQEVQGQV